jgi:UDP-2,3-diacylglucosamine pyrophosphatase LpxH
VFALGVSTYINVIRRKFGLTYWSLSAWAKLKVKNAVNFISEFEDTLSNEAARLGVQGVICGHIHHAAMRDMDSGVRYINTGDWVESCTAVAENYDGTFEIICWTRSIRLLQDDAEREQQALPSPARSAA